MNDMLAFFLAFLIGAGIGKAIVFVCETFIRKYYQSKKKISIIDDKHFSTSKYLEEIEKVHLSILEEKEKAKPYIITLWWGLDGIRLNKDGEPEWISRRSKLTSKLEIPNSNINFRWNDETNTVFFWSPYQCACQNIENSINSSIQSQIDQVQLQQSQIIQNAVLFEQLSAGRDMYGRIRRL